MTETTHLLGIIESNGTLRCVLSDEQGSVVALTDGGGNVTDTFSSGPYGEDWGRTGTNSIPFRWLGNHGVFNPGNTSLYITRHRAFDTTLKRWLSQDSLGISGGANLYIYGNSCPTAYIDPLGLFSWSGFGIGAGKAAIGLVVGVAVATVIVATAPASLAIGIGLAASACGGFGIGQSLYESGSGNQWTVAGNGRQLNDFERSESMGNATVGVAALGVLSSPWGRAGAKIGGVDKDFEWMKMEPNARMKYDNDLRMTSDDTFRVNENVPPGERGLTWKDQGFSWDAIEAGLSAGSRYGLEVGLGGVGAASIATKALRK